MMTNYNKNVLGYPRTFFMWFSLRYILHDLWLESVFPYIMNRYPIKKFLSVISRVYKHKKDEE